MQTPLEPPRLDPWVAVRVERVATSSKGRLTKPFEIHLGRVSTRPYVIIADLFILTSVLYCILKPKIYLQ